jgi:endogenous inhibitor of DNA gyrase (YacG/DUF329 family)
MTITCPECGSKDVRPSLSQTFGEQVLKVFGFYHIRCKDCDHRFRAQIWDFLNMVYARCPRCYRLDLSTWSTEYYRASSAQLLCLKLGGRRHRCAYCRVNFVGFRPAKLRYKGKLGAPIGGHPQPIASQRMASQQSSDQAISTAQVAAAAKAAESTSAAGLANSQS